MLGNDVGSNVTIITSHDYYFGANASRIGAGQYDFQSVVEHELGHAVGLGDSLDANSLMYYNLGASQVHRSLTVDDFAEIAADSTNSSVSKAKKVTANDVALMALYADLYL